MNPTVNNTGNNPQPLNNFFHGTLWAVPKYADGTYGLSTQGNNALMFNEIGGQSRQNTDYLAGSVKAEIDIADGLTFSMQIAGRGNFIGQKNFTNSYANTDKNTNITKNVAINSLTVVRNTLREYTINNLLNYEKSFGSHNIKALVGYSQIGNTQTFLSAYRERFYNNDIGSIGQGANDGTRTNSGNDAEYGLPRFLAGSIMIIRENICLRQMVGTMVLPNSRATSNTAFSPPFRQAGAFRKKTSGRV